MPDLEDQTYTVGDLNRLIRQALTRRFPDEVWVEGEMRGLKRHAASGHVYFELADPSEDGRRTDAVIQVALYRGDKDGVNRVLRKAGAVRMDNGVHIRIRGSIAYHPAQGRLQFQMRWIDPAYTLGRLEAERQRLVAALTTDGVLEQNAAIPFPLMPLRVGLVTSQGSAAQHDFLHELEASGMAWKVTLVAASVQGPGAELELVAALHACVGAGVDVVAVVRGGGARTDLAVFDGEHLARTIAGLPVPVITGIGHETDRAVADLVAARSEKTPTACAAHLVRHATGAHERARRAWDLIAARAGADLDRRHAQLDHLRRQVSFSGLRHLDRQDATVQIAAARSARAAARAPVAAAGELERIGSAVAAGARRRIDRAADATDDQRRRLVADAPRAVRRSEADLATRGARVAVADPERLLARGWTITRTVDGAAVVGAADVHDGQELVTIFRDGSVHSTVTRTSSRADPETHAPADPEPDPPDPEDAT